MIGELEQAFRFEKRSFGHRPLADAPHVHKVVAQLNELERRQRLLSLQEGDVSC